jgi:hypothetical protein
LEGTVGPTTAGDIDLVALAKIYTEPAGPEDKDLKTAYGFFSSENMVLKADGDVSVTIGRISARDFKARPTATPWLEIAKMLADKDVGNVPLAERTRIVTAVLDIFEAFDLGEADITDLVIDATTKDKQFKGRVGRINYRGGNRPESRVEKVEIGDGDGQVRVGSASLAGFSFVPTVKALRETIGKSELPSDFTPFMPLLGTMTVSDISVDLPADKPRDKNDRVKAGVKALQFIVDQPKGGIPTATRSTIDHFTFSVPKGQSDFKDLIELGYPTIDISMVVDQTWNEAASDYVFKEVSFTGAEMGSAALRGTLGNITKEAFSGDPTMIQVVLAGATVKTVTVTVENNGLFERIVAREAKRQSRKPEDIRKQYGAAAAVAVPAMLGNSAAAKTLGNAVARFIAKPGRLTVTATAKDSGGLGLADYMASGGDPGEILGKLDVTATAE